MSEQTEFNIPQLQKVELGIVVIRKDGTREDLGVVAEYPPKEGKGMIRFGAALLNKALSAIRKVKES